jgi:hypothetical protein
MAIQFSAPPTESDDAVRQGLLEIAKTYRSGINAEAAGGAIDPSSFTSPHQVYFARLDDLRDGKGVGSAHPQGWRYFVGPSGGRTAEVSAGGSSDSYTFVGLNTGQLNEQMQRLIQVLASDSRVEAQDFECRLLQVNALNLAVLWLKAKSSGDDLFVPINSVAPGLQAGHIYETDEFNRLLTAAALKKRDLEPPAPANATTAR